MFRKNVWPWQSNLDPLLANLPGTALGKAIGFISPMSKLDHIKPLLRNEVPLLLLLLLTFVPRSVISQNLPGLLIGFAQSIITLAGNQVFILKKWSPPALLPQTPGQPTYYSLAPPAQNNLTDTVPFAWALKD